MQDKRQIKKRRVVIRRAALLMLVGVALGGCTAPSVRLALEAQSRANAVQQFVFERQHEGLTALLYRDLVQRLNSTDKELSDEQLAAIDSAWNERDLIEFWAIQFERAKALRLIGVNAKLASDQSPVDLIIKALESRGDEVEQATAEALGEALVVEGE